MSHAVASPDLWAEAELLDAQDPIGHVRDEFQIPTRADISRKTLEKPADEGEHGVVVVAGSLFFYLIFF